MAFLKSSDSIIIKAVLTDEGRKLLSRGQFKISKFAFGDDEIDYELIDPDKLRTTDGYQPAINSTKLFEAYGDAQKNIQFGLNSFDSGILYLSPKEKRDNPDHAHVMFLPFLKTNNILGVSPTITGSLSYLSCNDETTEELNKINNFKFMTNTDLNSTKLVVESGLSGVDDPSRISATQKNKEHYILKKFLLDSEYFIYVDDRFIRNLVGLSPNSKFENFKSGETIIRFLASAKEAVPVSLESEFDSYATYVLRTIPNNMYDWETSEDSPSSRLHSVHENVRGSVLAFNPMLVDEMRTNSSSNTDFRFTKFGTTDKIIFSELPTTKFDYIDTTIYVIGSTTNTRVMIPLRIVRYSGTT
tara:strand:+ start:1716 stop:2789 length:1074 start_codon:yes stop_codon:yes gene_type:complete